MITDEDLEGLRIQLPPGWVKTSLRELQIRRKLGEFVDHKDWCWISIGRQTCTCGLSALLAKLKELEGV